MEEEREAMSLYNLLFGRNQHADFILATLGLTQGDVGRFRDAFVADGQIAVYTRNGGGNREEYQYVIDDLAKHPCYLSNRDDDFDCTYATIYFSFPELWKDDLKALESGMFNPGEQWQKKLDSLKEGELTPTMKAVGDMFLLSFLIVILAVPVLAQSQVACFDYGRTISCDSARGNTTITELSPGRGIITQQGRSGSSMEPYSIIGDRDRPRSGGIEPLDRLDRLPSSSSYGGSIYDNTTFEQRERIRESGRIPW